jgi:phenylpropionate dioxygenase-like ring-hydroxylating dioxygenase large terminal subunit
MSVMERFKAMPPAIDKSDVPAVPENWDRSGLPAWAYTSNEQLDLEKALLFRRHWQLAGHISNAPEPGNYFCFDVAGERAIIVRGKDEQIRVFHNVCRHRGSRVVVNETGTCGSAMVCPFHGWSFNLDGTLRTVAQPRTVPDLDPLEHGLVPVEFEIWQGFVFVRFQPGPQPAVKDILARHEAEITLYRPQEAKPTRTGFWSQEIGANWKCVRDVDNEGYHVPMAHPGLQDLYGHNYFDENWQGGTTRAFGTFRGGDNRLWSVRAYNNLLPEIDYLPETHQRAWLYIGMFPNTVLYFYPEGLGFYQEFPIATDKTLIRGGYYGVPLPDTAEETFQRKVRAARYLAERIDNDTAAEDIQLTVWSNEAAHSSGFQGFILSDLEYGVKQYHDQLREVMPALNLPDAPEAGSLEAVNKEMS